MRKSGVVLALLWVGLVGMSLRGAVGAQAGSSPQTSPDLKVHEWGTFTSVAGPGGQTVQWTPLAGPSDLPCFVSLLNPIQVKGPIGPWLPSLKATIRMETPVLYFYSPREQTVRVNVRFPQGLVTEWYPQASVPPVMPFQTLADTTGAIQWLGVKVRPNGATDFPVERGASHYYAARETDASPVEVGTQREKFLFYRGLASFPVRLSARTNDAGAIVLANSGAAPVPHVILFENDGQRFGYRVAGAVERDKPVTIARPFLSARPNFDQLRRDLEQMLVAEGLFAREAAAMVETWRDSWFEIGTRVFYLIPKATVDTILPLQIDPVPAEVARVFVGRLEVITPAVEAQVEQAIRKTDLPTLVQYGRFLEPIAGSLYAKFSATGEQVKVTTALRLVAAWMASAAEQSCK